MSRIAIIGGGFTGLTAALRLSGQGHEVEIFEASETIGGLAGSFKIEGENIEKTYHHLFRTDIHIIELVTELGLQDKLIWRDSSLGIYFEGKIYPFMTPFDLIKFPPLTFVDRVKTGITTLYLQFTKNWKKFENITAYRFMSKWTGKSSMRAIWEPLLKGKFDKYYDKVSMAWLWARIHIRANSRQKGESGEKLGYFKGGFQIVIDRILEELGRNKVKIHLKTPISKIEEDGEFVRVGNDSFDKAIATIPSGIFGKLIESNKSVSEKYIAKLNSIDYLGAVVMVFSSEQDIGEYYWNNINDLESPFLVFLNHTKLIDKSNYNEKYVYYIGSYVAHSHKYFEISNEQLELLWFDYLKKIFPDFDVNQIREKHLFKLKNAQHIVDLNYKSKIPDYKTPIKNLFLANFSQIYPEDRGTNYAVREGNKIAELIMSEL
jgi:protoporphyrinogen oxidase